MQVAPRALGDRAEVGLRHDEDVGDLHDPRLQELQDVAAAGLHHDGDGIGHLGDLGLGLPDADGLDDDDVERRGQRVRGGARGGRQAAEPPAGRHRADEDATVARVDHDPRAVTEQRAARALGGGIDGEDGHGALVRPPRTHELGEQRGLARSGRAGDADDVRGRLAAEGGGGDRLQQRLDVLALSERAALDEVQDRRRRAEVALAQALAEVVAGRGHAADASTGAQASAAAPTPLRSATSATMSRMMRVRSKSLGV